MSKPINPDDHTPSSIRALQLASDWQPLRDNLDALALRFDAPFLPDDGQSTHWSDSR